MKLSSLALISIAIVALSWSTSAQSRSRAPSRNMRATAEKPVHFGSVARTKLLQQARGRNAGSADVLRLGSVERRAALTGTSLQVKKPERRLFPVRHTRQIRYRR
jgi:hypothetical protein